MGGYSHRFVEEYTGLVGFGSDRATDEASLTVYLQQLSDDELMSVLRRRMSDQEIDEFVDLISRTLRKHLNDQEYHNLFLKDPHEH
jgi:hypothetical protein